MALWSEIIVLESQKKDLSCREIQAVEMRTLRRASGHPRIQTREKIATIAKQAGSVPLSGELS